MELAPMAMYRSERSRYGSYRKLRGGNIGEQTALVLLKPQKPDDQHAFITHPALANLRESAPV